MTALTSLGLFVFSVMCYGIKELQAQNKLKWQDEAKDFFSFWGRNSWVRKYAGKHERAAIFENIKNRNWYYRFFKIKHKERFPGSATIFVFMTDGYHLCQWFFIKLIVLSVITFDGDFSIKWFLIYLAIWYLIFNLTYKLLSK